MTLSFNLFGRNFRFGGAEKAISPDMAAWVRAEDVTDASTGATLREPYVQSEWVYVAISRLAEKVSSIPFRISRLETTDARRVRALRGGVGDARQAQWRRRALADNIIESGDVVDLFNCPHPTMNRQLFWEMLVTWNCLRGEFFVLPLDDMDQPVDMAKGSARVRRLLTVPTELFWHVVSGYELQGWRYTGSPLLTPIPGQMLLPSEVIHARTPNPYLYWRGLSPLLVAMLPASADFAASKYNQGYWVNNADTGVIVTTDQQATPEQRAAILSALRERKRKAGTADRPLFLWGGAKVEKPTLTGMESSMIENRRMNRQSILAIFKLSDSIVGLTDAKSSALSGGGNAINAEEIKFVESTLSPLCEHIESALAPVVNSFGEGLVGWFDLQGLPVMQEARRARLDAGVKAFGIGASFNDINEVYDLGFPRYAGWGDKNFLPFSLQDAGSIGAEELPGEEAPAMPTDEEKSNPFARMQAIMARAATQATTVRGTAENEALWRTLISKRNSSVKLMKAKTTKVLHLYRGKALATLSTFDLAKSVEQRSLVDLLFSSKNFGQALLAELTNPILAALKASGAEALREIGVDDPWNMPPEAAKDYLHRRTLPVMECGETVRERLNDTLNAGLDEGENIAELTVRVRELFNSLTNYEADRIARTETNLAYNHARQESFKGSGIRFKAWLSSHGPHVRPAHAQAERDYSIDTPIPMEQPFRVGGEELMYPGDDSLGAGAGNIINCQCIQLAAKKKSEDAKTITFEVCGVGEMTFSKHA